MSPEPVGRSSSPVAMEPLLKSLARFDLLLREEEARTLALVGRAARLERMLDEAQAGFQAIQVGRQDAKGVAAVAVDLDRRIAAFRRREERR